MRAKECADIYLAAEDKKEAFGKIGGMFINETSELIKKRNITTASGLNGILREQKMKWIAFCRKTDGEFREDGYQILITSVMPELERYFNQAR